jgi:hypothetical protein
MSAQRKVVVVTGASQGIGAGLVRGYLDHGYQVVANSRSIKPDGSADVLTVAGDITDPAPGIIKTPMHAPATHAALAGLHPLAWPPVEQTARPRVWRGALAAWRSNFQCDLNHRDAESTESLPRQLALSASFSARNIVVKQRLSVLSVSLWFKCIRYESWDRRRVEIGLGRMALEFPMRFEPQRRREHREFTETIGDFRIVFRSKHRR